MGESGCVESWLLIGVDIVGIKMPVSCTKTHILFAFYTYKSYFQSYTGLILENTVTNG